MISEICVCELYNTTILILCTERCGFDFKCLILILKFNWVIAVLNIFVWIVLWGMPQYNMDDKSISVYVLP